MHARCIWLGSFAFISQPSILGAFAMRMELDGTSPSMDLWIDLSMLPVDRWNEQFLCLIGWMDESGYDENS